MAKTPKPTPAQPTIKLSTSVEELLANAVALGDDNMNTGRFVITFQPDAGAKATEFLTEAGMRVVDAREFPNQAVNIESLGNADALMLPEIGVAVVTPAALENAKLMPAAPPPNSPVLSIDPEHFVFAIDDARAYLRGFLQATEAIVDGLGAADATTNPIYPEVSGATWGLNACKVPPSVRSGSGIRVAVLDTGMDFGHPDFVGRTFVSETFAGEPPHDGHGHGTHCIGTACGPKAPPGSTPRYGIGYETTIFVGKVLTNGGSGTGQGVLAGMNWAVANRCVVISMSLGSRSPEFPAYTAAGQRALDAGCLIVAAAGNAGGQPTGAPANSPTIMAVASLDPNLQPSVFSSEGKIEIAAPGRDVFSSLPRPQLYGTFSGTSMATPHVAGCAALWAQTSSTLRGKALWNQLVRTARPLPSPPTRVGAGLVQAPA